MCRRGRRCGRTIVGDAEALAAVKWGARESRDGGRYTMRRAGLGIICSILTLAAGAVAEEPNVVLRMAAQAPDGTEWARESRAFAQDVEDSTQGAVRIKWYFGGIAGTELDELERMRRGQLDGIAGALLCERLAPSLFALEMLGMVRSQSEAAALLREVLPVVDKELAPSPYRALFVSLGFGHRVLFSRNAVRSLADLRSGRYWVWDVDEALRRQLTEMGVHVVPLPLGEARRAYEQHDIDGFFVIPQAALAFQYSSIARYYTDLETGYLPGCVLMKTASIDQIPYAQQLSLIAAAGKLKAHFENTGLRMDDQLMHTLFVKQGLEAVPMSAAFRDEWFREGRAVYQKLREQLVPSAAGRALLEAPRK
jgi:TRAP-type C4-dicarboxylate transport system substrate-binding protein